MHLIRIIANWLVQSAMELFAKVTPIPKPLVYSGSGSSLQLCDAISSLGHKNVLLVTDKVLMDLGLLSPICERLASKGVDVTIYDGVLPDPTAPQVLAAVDVCKANGCDAIIGVGGGSVLDTAKAVGALAAGDITLAQIVGYLKLKQPPMPLFLVPTTAGTGSEVTVASIISDPETHVKMKIVDFKLVPQAAALDSDLMLGMPKPVTAATGMDALTHAIESFLARTANDNTEKLSIAAITTIFEALPVCYEDGSNREARDRMALAAMWAGMAFTRTSVGWVHAFAHNLGAHYGIPHGQANALMLAPVLTWYKAKKVARLDTLAGRLGMSSDEFIANVEKLARDVGIPAKNDKLTEADVPTIAGEAVSESTFAYPVPRFMTRRDAIQVLSSTLA